VTCSVLKHTTTSTSRPGLQVYFRNLGPLTEMSFNIFLSPSYWMTGLPPHCTCKPLFHRFSYDFNAICHPSKLYIVFVCPSPCYLIHVECHVFLRVVKVDSNGAFALLSGILLLNCVILPCVHILHSISS
jgi:hypothetical protein